MTTNPLLLTRAEVALMLSICEQTVYHLEQSNVLPAVRIGRAVRYRRSDVEQLAGDDGGQRGKSSWPRRPADLCVPTPQASDGKPPKCPTWRSR